MKTCIVCKAKVEDADVEIHLANNHTGPHFFWFDGIKYKTMSPSLTVGELIKLVNVSPYYFVYQDKFGAGKDPCFSHGVSVDLTREPHFYAVPPATPLH